MYVPVCVPDFFLLNFFPIIMYVHTHPHIRFSSLLSHSLTHFPYSTAGAALADSRRTAGRRLPLSQGSMSAPAPASASTRARALQNIAHCVVGMQEQWGSTVDHLLHFFPWLKAGAETETRPGANGTESVWRAAPRRMQLFAGQESLLTLRPALRIAIETANSCDMALYVKMQEMFKHQQQVVDTLQLFV